MNILSLFYLKSRIIVIIPYNVKSFVLVNWLIKIKRKENNIILILIIKIIYSFLKTLK